MEEQQVSICFHIKVQISPEIRFVCVHLLQLLLPDEEPVAMQTNGRHVIRAVNVYVVVVAADRSPSCLAAAQRTPVSLVIVKWPLEVTRLSQQH